MVNPLPPAKILAPTGNFLGFRYVLYYEGVWSFLCSEIIYMYSSRISKNVAVKYRLHKKIRQVCTIRVEKIVPQRRQNLKY